MIHITAECRYMWMNCWAVRYSTEEINGSWTIPVGGQFVIRLDCLYIYHIKISNNKYIA